MRFPRITTSVSARTVSGFWFIALMPISRGFEHSRRTWAPRRSVRLKNEIYPEIELAKKSLNWGTLKALSLVLFLIGAAAFFYQLFAGDATRAWSAYLTNYVYWTGLAFGAFLLSPVLVLTNATWGRPVKRLSESVALFSPCFLHTALASFPRKGECFLVGAPSGRTKSAMVEYAFFLRARGHRAACHDCHSGSARLPFRQKRHGIYGRGFGRRRTANALSTPCPPYTSSSMRSF